VKNKLPGLSKAKNVYIVSDEESAIVEAMRQNLPTTDIYRCWNHVMQNAKFNLNKFGIKSKSEISVYLDDIWELLAQTDHKKYTDLLLKRIASWNQVFLN
jgi:transposase-like protein